MKIKGQVRQGDVLINPVNGIPSNAKRVESKDAIILAYGEVTGHKHQIADIETVSLYETPEGRRFLVVNGEAAELVHEEHGTVAITRPSEPVIQEEYDFGASRQVAD